MTYGAIAALLSLYVIYVIFVAVADFTKRAGVEWGDIGVRLSKHVSMKIRQNGLVAPLLPRRAPRQGSTEEFENNNLNMDRNGAIDGSNGRYIETEESVGLGEVESEVPEDVLPTVAHVPPGNNTTISSLGHSISADSKKSNASEVELMTSPPISRPRSPVRGAQSLPPPFSTGPSSAPFPEIMESGGGGGTAHPSTRRLQTLGYDELVHMPAKEYRQRALADMAAAVSFYKGRRGTAAADAIADLEALEESEEEVEEEESEGGGVRDEERGEYTPPEIPPVMAIDTTQNIQPPLPAVASEAAATPPSGGRATSAPAALSLPPATSLPQSVNHTGNGAQAYHGLPGAAFPVVVEEESAMTEFDRRLASLGQALESAAKPVMILLKSTIPIVEMTSYNKFWFLLTMAASPLFICTYLGTFTWRTITTAIIAGTVSSSFCALCTKNLNENEAPLWDLGSGYPLGAGVIAIYGFAVAAMWIDIFASQIVGILHFFGLLAGVHPAVLGVTVLSWGNSLTDFVANTSMAGRSAGGTSMAMTACFAGPLFNMLVGLGIGFWAYLADTKQKSTVVKFDSVVLVGCIFAMLNCAGVVTVAVMKKHRLPGEFGWVMCGWYLLYMLAVLIICIH